MEACNICGSKDLKQFFSMEKVPAAANAPISEEDFAAELTGKLDIVMCQACSHVMNRAADPKIIASMYDKNYSSGIPNSPAVFEYLKMIIREAITERFFRDSVVLEIGASDFTFSKFLIEAGAGKCLAFEPSDLFSKDAGDIDIIHIPKYYSPDDVPEEYRGKVGLVIMRHLLEHMLEPAVFLRSVSKVLAQGAAVYIELPNLSDMLAKKRPYDFFYEHVNYFSPELLARFMESEGFEKVKVTMLKDGQHFGLLCRKVSDTPAPPGRPITLAVPGREESIQGFQDHVKSFKKALSDVCAKHSHIAVYGAGNHSIAVAAMMGWTSDDIECFLDINKMKSGFYTGVSHILITLPTPELVQKFDAIIIIASLHEVEIHKNLRLQFCFKGDIYSTYKEVRPLD